MGYVGRRANAFVESRRLPPDSNVSTQAGFVLNVTPRFEVASLSVVEWRIPPASIRTLYSVPIVTSPESRIPETVQSVMYSEEALGEEQVANWPMLMVCAETESTSCSVLLSREIPPVCRVDIPSRRSM